LKYETHISPVGYGDSGIKGALPRKMPEAWNTFE
jgi:hypothetical protein